MARLRSEEPAKTDRNGYWTPFTRESSMLKSFREYCQIIKEAANRSLSRTLHHIHKTEMGTMSASRGENTPHQNNVANKNLEHDLRSRGHSIVHTHGDYEENQGTPQARKVHEHSMIVHARQGSPRGELLTHMKELGTKYKQDSILHKHADDHEATIHSTKHGEEGQHFSVGKAHANTPNPNGETHLKGKRSVTFKED